MNSADDPKEVIVNAARRLDHNGVPEGRLGIQFAQIGDDEDATEGLRELDEGIADVNGIRASLWSLTEASSEMLMLISRIWWIRHSSTLMMFNSQPTLSSKFSLAQSMGY